MQTALMGWVHQLGTLEYWEALLVGFEGLGPLVPILLAMVESFFPPLPLIAIVALNVAAHGGLLGFLYSWAGVALGGIIMFLFWRRLIKRFFWKVASRSPKLEKAQQWVNRFDTSSLFMLSLLPFTPTSFMHFAFGMSDFDERRYLRAVLLGKGLMVAMMAVFGQSLVSSLKNPVYLVLAVLLWGGMYWVSKQFCKKHNEQKILPEASSGITRYCSGQRKHLRVCRCLFFCRKSYGGQPADCPPWHRLHHFYFASGSCTRGSDGGGVRVECATTKAAAFARARRWRTLRVSLAGKVRSPSSFSFQCARAAFTSASVGCKPSRSATS